MQMWIVKRSVEWPFSKLHPILFRIHSLLRVSPLCILD
jgi:hypothetical protein